ncbi:ubiquitin carboxyl-terminal hydrolase MINDY-3-like [Littorina saxatilis]|uniref:Ubiquitin carboxyl-terminal hydrolase MINDY n=1 Tax=Littorina saxatilis TaxID=31220 RepID=A0AAN9GJA4_9CAEN
MAAKSFTKVDDKSLESLRLLLWGPNLKDEVFMRWTQGFVFSEDENTALVQLEGGPCAVIAPVQGFLLKNALFTSRTKTTTELSSVTVEQASTYLYESLGELMESVEVESYLLVCLEDSELGNPSSSTSMENAECLESGESSPKRRKMDQETFHNKLRCVRCERAGEMRQHLKELMPEYQQDFGVLLYLYSLLLTKGLEQIKNDMEDPSEPMIDGIHGHGSQSLINLFLTSRAISNVWDNDKEVSGLKLRGIQRQSTIGFLTLLEHLRYCEVGWYLKNPQYPIWLLGSETHLTVLFSPEKNLVVRETPASNARTVFAQYDPEGNGFISATLLGDVLSALDLVSDSEYVDIMRAKLDAEELGIITRTSFMDEFFPEEDTASPSHFPMFHYNGLPRSCPGGKVRFQACQCQIQEELEVQIITDSSSIKMTLQTKWPTIDVKWTNDRPPSLN